MSSDKLSLRRYQVLNNCLNSSGPGGTGDMEAVRGSVSYMKDMNMSELLPLERYKTVLCLGTSWKEMMSCIELGYDTTGIALSKDVVDEIRATGLKCIHNDMCDMQDVANESFDAIFTAQSLEHTFYPWKVLFETWRVLRFGGRALHNLPLWPTEDQVKEPPHFNSCSLAHCSVFMPFQLKAMARTCGFKVINHEIKDNLHNLCVEKITFEEMLNYPEDGEGNVPHGGVCKYYKNKTIIGLLKEYCKEE